MSTPNDQIGFDELPDSKQSKTIDKAGIHRNFFLFAAEFQLRANKKEKKKNEKTGEMEEVESSKTIGPWAKFTLKGNEEDQQFVITMFPPPTNAEEIKFYSDKYENGVAIRKNTVEEQIRSEFNKKFYFYEQLAKAVQIAPDKFLTYKKNLKGTTDTLFKDMFDKFFGNFPVERIKVKPIDFKALWNNNATAKTSFLQIADASSNNLVFAPYIKERDTLLSVTQYEQKEKMIRKFSNNDRAPTTNATEISKSGNTWKPIAEGADAESAAAKEVDDDTLF